MPVDGFKWVENTPQNNKYFIEDWNEDSNDGYFLKIDVQYSENVHNLHHYFPFFPERMKF